MTPNIKPPRRHSKLFSIFIFLTAVSGIIFLLLRIGGNQGLNTELCLERETELQLCYSDKLDCNSAKFELEAKCLFKNLYRQQNVTGTSQNGIVNAQDLQHTETTEGSSNQNHKSNINSDLLKDLNNFPAHYRSSSPTNPRQLKKHTHRNHDQPQRSEACSPGLIPTREMTEVLTFRDPDREAVYFIETSATGYIKPRFVCGLESAARAYSTGDVYLLIAFSPDTHGLNASLNENLNSVITRYKNIQVLHVDMVKLFTGTPLEEFYPSGKRIIEYFFVHASDIIRMLTVWKFGGKYFDSDVVIFKNLSQYKNFVMPDAPLKDSYLTNGAFGFAKHSNVGTIYMKLLSVGLSPNNEARNAPWMLTQSVMYHAGVRDREHIGTQGLKEVKFLGHETLHPLPDDQLWKYFDESRSDETMQELSRVHGLWGVHVANGRTAVLKVRVDSKQPYALLAQQYCPRAYWGCHDEF